MRMLLPRMSFTMTTMRMRGWRGLSALLLLLRPRVCHTHNTQQRLFCPSSFFWFWRQDQDVHGDDDQHSATNETQRETLAMTEIKATPRCGAGGTNRERGTNVVGLVALGDDDECAPRGCHNASTRLPKKTHKHTHTHTHTHTHLQGKEATSLPRRQMRVHRETRAHTHTHRRTERENERDTERTSDLSWQHRKTKKGCRSDPMCCNMHAPIPTDNHNFVAMVLQKTDAIY